MICHREAHVSAFRDVLITGDMRYLPAEDVSDKHISEKGRPMAVPKCYRCYQIIAAKDIVRWLQRMLHQLFDIPNIFRMKIHFPDLRVKKIVVHFCR